MAEDTANVESFSSEQITQARYRLASRAFRQFLPAELKSDAPQNLSQVEVQEKCFAALGFLEQYYRVPDVDSPAVIPDESLKPKKRFAESATLEQQVDNELRPANNELRRDQLKDQADAMRDKVVWQPKRFPELSDKEKSEAKLHLVNERVHHEEISAKLNELFAFPQVQERFEKEFDKEFAHYQAARDPMRKVRDIDRITGKLRQAIYKRYLVDKQQHGTLTQSSADKIYSLQGSLDELEKQKKGIEDTASPSTLGYLETQKLLDYKRQLREKGFVMTPSREQLIDRITREALGGKKIFLVGSTGTGKTQLAFYALNNLTGGYELINWHEGTTPRDLFGYRELWTDEIGGVQSGMKSGPIPKALERRVGVIHEEYTGGSTRTQLAAKFMMGAKPGDKIQIPGFNGQIFDVTNNFIEVFTGNPKDERTKQREEMDPAILRELTGVEVSYMSATEMNDIIKARLMEESGVLKLSVSETKYVEQLTKAAEMMQKVHNRDFEGFTPEIKTLLGIDAQGNTDTTLNTNFLDPGTLFKLFGEWELASARGENFAEYMRDKLREFVTDPKTLSHPEERRTLQKILHSFGLTTGSSAEFDIVIQPQDKGYILPSEMAGNVVLSNQNPMDTQANGPDRRGEMPPGLQAQEQKAWQETLGVQIDIPRLPEYVTPEVIKNLENYGMELRFIPQLDLQQNFLRSKNVSDYLTELSTRYPHWKPYEQLTDQEKTDHTVVRNLRDWYWQQVKANKVNFPILPGVWMAVETMEKPAYGNQYPTSQLTTEMGLSDRFNVTWNKAKEAINNTKQDVLRNAGLLPGQKQMRMLTALEWNLLANRDGWGATNTYEWVEDEFRGSGASRRLIVGYSGSGGTADADWNRPDSSLGNIGFRVAVVLDA